MSEIGNGKLKSDELIDLQESYKRIVKHPRIIVSVLFVCVLISVAVALLSTPYYQSTTKIVYQGASQSAGGLAALASLAGVSVGSTSEDASAYLVDILKSANTLNVLLEKKWQIADSTGPKSQLLLKQLWKYQGDTSKPHWQRVENEELLRILYEGDYITFIQDKKTGVFILTTSFEDPQVSLDVNIFLFEALNETLVNKMNSKAKANRQFIEGRLSEVKQDLARSENILRGYKERNRLRLDPGDVLEENRLQRNVIINQEVMIQLQKQYEMAKIEEAKDLPVLDVIDSPRLAIEKTKPKRKVIVLLGVVIGLILGCTASLLYDFWKQHNHR